MFSFLQTKKKKKLRSKIHPRLTKCLMTTLIIIIIRIRIIIITILTMNIIVDYKKRKKKHTVLVSTSSFTIMTHSMTFSSLYSWLFSQLFNFFFLTCSHVMSVVLTWRYVSVLYVVQVRWELKVYEDWDRRLKK